MNVADRTLAVLAGQMARQPASLDGAEVLIQLLQQ